MHCHFCSSPIASHHRICPECGATQRASSTKAASPDLRFCHACGSQVALDASDCVHCGSQFRPTRGIERAQPPPPRSWAVTLVLAMVLGYTGAHRFYTGHVAIAVLQLCTFGGCGLWWIADVILIAMDGMYDVDGQPLRR